MASSRQQLMDTLTSHIALYHLHQTLTTPQSPNPRSAILKWFAALSLHHRLAALTTVDGAFVQILLQMLRHLQTRGPGLFFVLPDIKSGRDPNLPSLCYRKCEGLLARIGRNYESAIWDAVRIFEAKEGECLDTVTFREELVEDVGRFVEVMDGVSGGSFLRGEAEGGMGLGGEWVEMGWLKERGYYGVEAYVVNRVEVSLRLAWMMGSGGGGGGGKRRGVVKGKGKEKVGDVVGVAANAYWRKKGLVDWWEGLEDGMRRSLVAEILGRRGRALVLFSNLFACCSYFH